MKKLIYICIIAFAVSCGNENEGCRMTISEASEIYFWDADDETFNEHQGGFIDRGYCFHEKFRCQYDRKFQFWDTVDDDYQLQLLDRDGEEIDVFDYEQTVNGIYLQLLEDGVNDTSVPDGASHQPWTLGSAPTVTIASPFGASAIFWLKLYGAEANTDYNFDYDILRSFSVAGQVNLYIATQAYKDTHLGSPLASHTAVLDEGTFAYTGDANLPAYIGVEVVNGGSGISEATINEITWQEQTATELIFVYSLTINPFDEGLCDSFVKFNILNGLGQVVKKSDYVNFVSEWANGPSSGNVTIQFKSLQNFADLIYNADSEFFMIELDGRFFHGDNETTSKTIETTDSEITTATLTKKTKLLQIDAMADYAHDKVILVLMHSTSGLLVIDGKNWTFKGGYEKTLLNEHNPLKIAQVTLVETGSLIHNLI